MNPNLLNNILTIIACVSIIITGVFVVRTFIETYSSKRKSHLRASHLKEAMADYDKIVKATYEIETEREKNRGEHKDETVYLNRATIIREKSPFFSWVR